MRWDIGFVVFGVACVGDRGVVQIPVVFEGTGSDVVSLGGEVELRLTDVSVSFGPLRLEGPAEPVVWRWWPISTAVAHPGHGASGRVVGELLGQWTVDPLGDPRPLGEASCFEGEVASGRLLLGDAVLEGMWVRGETEVPFRFEVSLDEELSQMPLEVDVEEGFADTLHLGFSASEALAFVDGQTQDEDADGELTLSDENLGNTVLFGMVSHRAWTLWTEE